MSIESGIPKEASKEQIAIVDISEAVKNQARDVAEMNLDNELAGNIGLKRIVSEIWKGNLWRELYLTKEINTIRKKILDTGKENIYAGDTDDRTYHIEAINTVVNRFISEYDENLYKNSGETKDELLDSGDEKVLKLEIQELIREYAIGFIDVKTFEERKTGIFKNIKATKNDIIKRGDLYADNLLEIANNVKEAVNHGKKLYELDLDYDVIIGKAKMGVRTETQYTYVDRLIENVLQSKIGKFVNEYTVTTAISIAYCIWAKLNKDVSDNKLVAIGTMGVSALFGSLTAGIKEFRNIRGKRNQLFREIAKGHRFEPEKLSELQKEIEQYKYEAKDANDLSTGLEDSLYSSSDDKTVRPNFTFEEFQIAASKLAEVESRINMSDMNKIDLINYSDPKKIEQERLNLNKLRFMLKLELSKAFKHESIQKQVGVNNFDEYLDKITQTITLELAEGSNGFEMKNSLFVKMRQKRVIKAAIAGFFAGLTVGAIAQEVSSIVKNNLQPLEYLSKYLNGNSVLKYGVLGLGKLGSMASDSAFAEVTDFTKEEMSKKLQE